MAIGVAAINSIGQRGSFISPCLWGIAENATGGFRPGNSLLPIGFVVAALIMLRLGRQATTRRTADIASEIT